MDIPPGASIVYTVTGTIVDGAEAPPVMASVDLMITDGEPELNTSNNSDSSISSLGLFLDSFEVLRL